MTTAAVAGAWWKNGLDSRCTPGREPPGYRLIEVDDDGRTTNRYIPYLSPDEEPAEYFAQTPSGRRFINVYDGSPKTQVEVDDLGPLNPIDPLAESSLDLSPHFYELPADYDRARVRTRIRFEDGRSYALELMQRSGGLEYKYTLEVSKKWPVNFSGPRTPDPVERASDLPISRARAHRALSLTAHAPL